MARRPTWLQECRQDIHSQSGEDGIIAAILALFPNRDNWCVEFGAWDGLYLSNAANLIRNKNYSGVLIENDPTKLRELERNYSGNAQATTLGRMVGYSGGDTLDAILAPTAVPKDFDFLSIDIDGNDYHVWQAVSRYRPKLVCIEFNPTIPTEVTFIQERRAGLKQGSSLLALTELAREKGYELACVLPVNAFFVKRELFPLLEIDDNRPQTLRVDTQEVTYLFTGYDGTVFLSGSRRLPWHGVAIKPSLVQVLPSFLRRFPDDYSPLHWWAFKKFLRIRGK
jgi:hypothetical protein